MGAGGFFGAILILAGVLIAALCGLCTLLDRRRRDLALVWVGWLRARRASGGPQNYGGGAMIPLALLLGGVPTVFGLLMIWAGIVQADPLQLPAAGQGALPPPVKPETFE